MQLSTRENDFESLVAEKEEEKPLSNDGDTDDSAAKTLEFVLLSSILSSEVKELESVIGYLQNEIQSAHVLVEVFEASDVTPSNVNCLVDPYVKGKRIYADFVAAMVHELIGLQDIKVDLKAIGSLPKDQQMEVVLSSEQDIFFFTSNLSENFGIVEWLSFYHHGQKTMKILQTTRTCLSSSELL